MLSFVVQNFYKPTPFFTKTRKYNEYVLMLSSKILTVTLKYVLQFYTNPYCNQFRGPHQFTLLKYFFSQRFWNNFRFKNIKSFGVYTNTFVLSILYKKYYLLSRSANIKIKGSLIAKASPYLRPIPVLYFSFQKVKYNSLIVLLLKTCVGFYSSAQIMFTLSYGFLLFQPNYLLYNFINKYYFQIRNY